MSTRLPSAEEADDVLLPLPPSDGTHDDHDDSELDAEPSADTDEDNESIDLDVSVGFDQEADIADLIEDLGNEGQAWTGLADGTETAQELFSIDARDLSDGDEYGWTDDNEAAGDAVAHREDELSDGDLPVLGTDADAEGFDDERPSDRGTDGDNDIADLPPMDAGEGDLEGGELFDASLLGRLDTLAEAEPERVEFQPGVYWAWFPRGQVRVTALGDTPHPLNGPAELFHWGRHVWLRSGSDLIKIDASDSQSVISMGSPIAHVLVDARDDSCVVSAGNGLFRVRESGARVDLGGPSADAAMTASAAIGATMDGVQTQLWAQSRLGTLFARLTDPERWTLVDSPRPGRYLATDGRRTLAYLLAATDRPCQLVQSGDGGATWNSRTLGNLDANMLQGVAVCRDVTVVLSQSMTTPVIASVGDEEPSVLIDGLRAPVALVYEDGEVVLYGSVLTPERTLLIRQPLGSPRRKPSVVHSWAASEGVVPMSIAARYDDAVTDLVVLAGGRLLRFRLEIERDNVG